MPLNPTSHLNTNDSTEKLYEKLDTLFLENANQSTFMAYESFNTYQRQNDAWLDDFLVKFGHQVPKLKDPKILLPELGCTYRALKVLITLWRMRGRSRLLLENKLCLSCLDNLKNLCTDNILTCLHHPSLKKWNGCSIQWKQPGELEWDILISCYWYLVTQYNVAQW